MADSITTLSLCSGVGWLDEAVGAGCRYFGWDHRVAAYCEWEAYAAAVLMARMEESSLEPAPVWSGDLGQFDGAAFRGKVDGITAGFPCQPWSAAGKQLGTADDRWLWPAIVRIIDDVEPGFVFLENVSALIAGGGLEHVLSDLAKMGFDAEWCCLTAEAVGAAHRRERVFILAYDPGARGRGLPESAGRSADSDADGSGGGQLGDSRESASPRDTGAVHAAKAKRRRKRVIDGNLPVGPESAGADVAHAECAVSGSGDGQERPTGERRNRLAIDGDAVADAQCERSQGLRPGVPEWRGVTQSRGGDGSVHTHEVFAPGPGADWSAIPEALWPATERGVRVLVDGIAVVLDASRADQLRCSGNGVVALCGATAFVELVRRAGIANAV